MRKLFSVLTAAAVCAALLAGCGDAGNTNDTGADNKGGIATAAPAATPGTDAGDAMPDNAGPDSTATGETATGETATGETAGTAQASGTAYSAEGLRKALSGLLDVAPDAAGGSLQTAQAAAALVEFAADCGTETATLGADAQAWLDALTDAEREQVKQTWAGVRDRARAIHDDYEGSKDILADAGITADFSKLDMSGVDAFLNTVDSILGL